MKTAEELEKIFGYSTEELDKMAEPLERGELPPGITIRRGKGRPRISAEDLQLVTVKMSPEMISSLDNLARESQKTRSQVIRECLEKELALA